MGCEIGVGGREDGGTGDGLGGDEEELEGG